jgi:hypothetical protein
MPRKKMQNGVKFGRLTVIKPYHSKNSCNRSVHLCRCICGIEKTVDGAHLTSGATVSCGCHRAESAKRRMTVHGKSSGGAYRSWVSIKARCNDKENKSYTNYGGRGIKMCERWNDFELFLSDMGPRPGGLSIDRKDNDDGYYKENCRWSTRTVQSRNRRPRTELPCGIRRLESGSYAAGIGVNRKKIYLGSSKSLDEVIRMRLEAEDKYWGDER